MKLDLTGNPANFLDIGGGADAEAMKLAFKLLLSAKPKALFGASCPLFRLLLV